MSPPSAKPASRQHALEAAAQGGLDLTGLADPARGAGPQHDRALGQDEGGILDEDRIGKASSAGSVSTATPAASSAAT